LALRFAPRWYWILLTVAAVPLFISLGFWQWHRGEYRRAQWDEFARTDGPAVEANAAQLPRLARFTRVRVAGHFDDARQFLLDNISHGGAPGYEVLSVLALADGSRLLVNRGWVPFSGYREQLPDVRLEAAQETGLTGRVSTLPAMGLASGQVPPPMEGRWPRVTSFPSYEQLAASYGEKLLPVVLLLDANSAPGYLRDWRPPGLSPDRHFGYAVQWWSFALLALALFIGLNLKRRNV
jgi:cytochrome oxidase assembly protein ShyY1